MQQNGDCGFDRKENKDRMKWMSEAWKIRFSLIVKSEQNKNTFHAEKKKRLISLVFG